MKYSHLKLKVLDEKFKYVLFNNIGEVENLLTQPLNKNYISIFLSKDEISAILPSDMQTDIVKKTEDDWSCLKIVGEMPFGSVQGLISHISSLLAPNNIGVCIVSTFLTDLFFIRNKYLDSTVSILRKNGWTID